jgi:KamA family protein
MIPSFKSYGIKELSSISQLNSIDQQLIDDIKVASEIYPFKTNNYVVDNLIDWSNWRTDPIFRLNFPDRKMLTDTVYEKIKTSKGNIPETEYNDLIHNIRLGLNPHPAGQMDLNTPYYDSARLDGLQHKYQKTVLFFPSQGQTCHAYCTFCFRWPQFVNDSTMKIQAREIKTLLIYLRENPQISEVLFTGGDPMIMNSATLSKYILPILDIPHIQTVRIGTKALSYWPFKFVTDDDSTKLLQLFSHVIGNGKHLALMAHFNHPVELSTPIIKEAISKLTGIGVTIRSQGPLLKNINNNARTWSEMWELQVHLGCIPYYMFLPRDTGAQQYFSETLQNAHKIFTDAIQNTAGLCKTVRGPIMSVTQGKLELLDIHDDAFFLRYIQHRNPKMAYKVFLARSKRPDPIWFDDLAPYDNSYDKFFKI